MTAMKHIPLLVLALSVFTHIRAQAQVGEDANITTRSDVTMSIDGAMGTGGARLDALAARLGTALAEIKRCYAQVVTKHPEVTGTVLVDLELQKSGPMRVLPVDAANLDKGLRRCFQIAFSKVSGKNVERPAKARVVLVLTNSAAQNVPDVRAREEEAAQVEIKTGADGRQFSEGQSLEGEVHFSVSAAGSGAAPVIEGVHNGVRDALPALFDCRRKSSKLASPEGEVVLDVMLNGQGVPRVQVRSCSVESERASPCVDRALTQGLARTGRGRAEVTVRFTP